MEHEQDPSRTTLIDEEKFTDHSNVDSEDTTSLVLQSIRARFCRVTLIFLAIIVVLLLYLTLLHKSQKNPKYNQCGTTADEARARGCVFETTGFTWLPKACHDADTEEEFLEYIRKKDLKFYRDQNYTEVVPIKEVRNGDGPGFFVREQYHLTHCLFLIEKLHRALASGKVVDGQIKPTHHTEHCTSQVLRGLYEPGFREHDVQLSYTKFPYCGKAGGYNVAWDNHRGPLGWTDY